jgi:hypothetical protein
MRHLLLATFMLGLSVVVMGQPLDSYSLTITASRSVVRTPDQAVFQVTVISSLDIGLDEVVAALQGTGITNDNLLSVGTEGAFDVALGNNPAAWRWVFTLPVTLSKMSDTLASLIVLQRTIARRKVGLSIDFGVDRAQVSPQFQAAHPCSITDLMTDARAQAKQLADAAGFIVGKVLAVSDGGAATISFNPDSNILSGLPSFGIISFRGAIGSGPNDCTIVVKFQLQSKP